MPSPPPGPAESLYSHHATVLPVADLVRARDWYRDVLGFTVEFEWPDPPNYAVLSAGASVQLHLSVPEEPPPADPRPTLVYLFVHDVEALHQRVEANGARITFPLETQAYGMREFEVRDPDGHKLVFGQGVEAAEGDG
jgi:catechol 2,3-dioxygenase-like lactoylglutathione lyase family enzyme